MADLLGPVAGLVALLALVSMVRAAPGRDEGSRLDRHSFARPDEVGVVHLDLRLDVRFTARELRGAATWVLDEKPRPAGAALVLDTRGLTIERVTDPDAPGGPRPLEFRLGAADPILGRALEITVPEGTRRVRVVYHTAPEASALQWVAPEGTAGKKRPFLYTQSQAIHARSWIPCPDTPSVRFTYESHVRVIDEPDLRVVMAAEGPLVAAEDGAGAADPEVAHFSQPRAIPSYLVALAVGPLEFRPLGPRTGVWAEPEVVEKAAAEFADTEKMVEAAEKRFGPYRWGRYDLLVLPPSFPYGGMENPRLTFATPTILAGDRSQVALVAHELAHSWSGNLVTNATWRDFWLNEGLTVYVERRILDDVYGAARGAMERVLGHGELRDELAKLPPRDQLLHVDLSGRDPDEGVTRIPYEKGALFLETLAATLGREKVDAFLRGYFDRHAFRSITTSEFEADLKAHLLGGGAEPIDLAAWIHEPGLPAGASEPASPRFAEVAGLATAWASGSRPVEQIETKAWTTLEWSHFLRSLPKDLKADRMAELDAAFHLTDTGNAEVACLWLGMAARAGYAPADAALERFLRTVGRRRLILPLYEALAATPAGLTRARAIFEQTRGGYHPIAATSVADLLARAGAAAPVPHP